MDELISSYEAALNYPATSCATVPIPMFYGHTFHDSMNDKTISFLPKTRLLSTSGSSTIQVKDSGPNVSTMPWSYASSSVFVRRLSVLIRDANLCMCKNKCNPPPSPHFFSLRYGEYLSDDQVQ